MPDGVRAVLWDVGNVVVRWAPRTLYAKLIADPVELDRFLDEVCTMAWHTEHDRGLPFDDGVAALSARRPEHAPLIAAWRDRWWEMFSGAIPETEAAMEALAARGAPQYALTNMSAEVWPGVRAMSPAFRHLRDVVISGDERCVKPDARLYEIACARMSLRPEQVLFVDDSAANVEAAAALGFVVHRFDDPAALRPALERASVL